MNYVTYHEFIQDIKEFLPKLPRDIDFVEGIPRSGLIPGAMAAMFFNVQTKDCLQSRAHDRRTGVGIERPLLIDDSINAGNAFRTHIDHLVHEDIKPKLIKAAIYATPEGAKLVDYHYKIINAPRIFEWNIFNSWVMESALVDMDGVLCDDYPRADRDDEDYRRHLKEARPKIPTSYEIKMIITGRREKYRDATVDWLRRHGVRYKELVMFPNDRARAHSHVAMFKAQHYANANAKLFIESSEKQATDIVVYTGLPVYSMETNQILQRN